MKGLGDSLDLEDALGQFDAVEANLRRLEKIWGEMLSLLPEGVSFADPTLEGRRYLELSRSYSAIVAALPEVGAYRITAFPLTLNEIAQSRLDAWEIVEPAAMGQVEEEIHAPGQAIDEYRYRLTRARRHLVRECLMRLVAEIDSLLADLGARFPRDRTPVVGSAWDTFLAAVGQVERLAGSFIPRQGRWRELRRHVAWAQGQDVHDIATLDWPSVRGDIQANLYSELEPVPVSVDNLDRLVESKPQGPVGTELNWDQVSADEFERLVFNIVADAESYSNAQWLMRANAPDRGRDVSATRSTHDTLSGTRHERVIIQAKHWQSKSVGVSDVTVAVAQTSLWEPPTVHVLVIATSGRFTADAVAWVERRNAKLERPSIELWPDNHLELLLARRPHIRAAFHLH